MLEELEKVDLCIYVVQSKRRKIGTKKNYTSCHSDIGPNADPKVEKVLYHT